MGELEGIQNAWGYAEGGNGAVSMAIAKAAETHGATLFTESVSSLLGSIVICLLSLHCVLWLYPLPQPVAQITVNDKHEATGVVLDDGSEIRAKVVLSNATPKVTYLDLLDEVS